MFNSIPEERNKISCDKKNANFGNLQNDLRNILLFRYLPWRAIISTNF